MAADDAVSALNAWGDTPVACLQDIPMRAKEVALHSVCYGATIALAIASVRSGPDLHSVEAGFSEGKVLDDY